MGSIYLGYQMLQPYLFKQKEGSNTYMKLFKWLLNVVIHSFITYWFMPNTIGTDPMIFRFIEIKVVVKKHILPSTKHPPKRLTEHYFTEQVPNTRNMTKPHRRYVIYSKTDHKDK
jgi:hypothetical protein